MVIRKQVLLATRWIAVTFFFGKITWGCDDTNPLHGHMVLCESAHIFKQQIIHGMRPEPYRLATR